MKRITVGVDGSEAADRGLRWAVTEAELHGATLDLVLAYVIHPYASVFGEADRKLAQNRLDEVLDRNHSLLAPVQWSASVVDAAGVAASALIDVGADTDLIVVGSRGLGGFPRLALGSTSYRTAAHAHAPVAVIPVSDHGDDGHRDILVGVDDSPVARRALRWALDEAARRSVNVTIVHSYLLPVDPSPMAALNQQLYEQARTNAYEAAVEVVDRIVTAAQVPEGVEVERVVCAGPPAAALLDRATDRLLVTGTRGRGGFSRAVFGSVSQQVLHHTGGPVIVVP